jgi:hypothetical protein
VTTTRDIEKVLGPDWLPLPAAARYVALHPESLRRKMRFGELPDGATVKLGNLLLFDRKALESLRRRGAPDA